jgi:hypothetical protein
MASRKREVLSLVAALVRDYGCTERLMKNGHLRVSRPGHRPISVSLSSSDQRAIDNVRAEARRHLGADV